MNKHPLKEDKAMNQKMDILICIGTAVGANCIPCFEHLYEKACAAGLTHEEIKGAVALAERVKQGAHKALKACVNELLDEKETLNAGPCDCIAAGTGSCCA